MLDTSPKRIAAMKIHKEQPQLVIDAIRAVVEIVRSGKR